MNIITRASVKERIHVEQIIRSQPHMHNSGLVDIVTIPVRKCLGLSMDVYKPVGEVKEPLPIILDVHGGGLIAGRKEQNRNLGIQLARRGYIVFIPDYRLVPETDIFGQISDILDALAVIEAKAAEFGGNIEKLFVTADSAGAEFSLGEETKESYPGIWLTTDNVKSHRHCSWFRLELPNDTNDIVMGHLYAGDDDMETDQPLAIIADGIRADGDESKRILWVDEDVTCVKSMNDDYLNRQKAITEKQLSDLSSGIFLQNLDYIVYGKRLASKSENTVEFVENTIVSHNKQELDVVASGMEAMGLSVETGYYDPDDESSVDVPKQLIGFHYVVLKKKV